MSSGTSTAPSAASRSATSKRRRRSTTGLGRTKVGTKSAGMFRLVRPISMRSRKPAVVSTATGAPRRSRTALVPTVVPCTRRRTSRGAMPRAASPSSTAAASWRGREGTLVTTTRPVASSTAVRSVKVPPTSIPTMNMGRMIHSPSGDHGARTNPPPAARDDHARRLCHHPRLQPADVRSLAPTGGPGSRRRPARLPDRGRLPAVRARRLASPRGFAGWGSGPSWCSAARSCSRCSS